MGPGDIGLLGHSVPPARGTSGHPRLDSAFWSWGGYPDHKQCLMWSRIKVPPAPPVSPFCRPQLPCTRAHMDMGQSSVLQESPKRFYSFSISGDICATPHLGSLAHRELALKQKCFNLEPRDLRFPWAPPHHPALCNWRMQEAVLHP